MALVRGLRSSAVTNHASVLFTRSPFWSSDMPIIVTLIPGYGIGSEIAESVKQVIHTAKAPILWEEHYFCSEVYPRTRNFLPWHSHESIWRNKVAVVGPMATTDSKGNWKQLPVSRGSSYQPRKRIDFYANVRTYNSLPGYMTRYDDVNLVIIMENTEGEYGGLEHLIVDGVAQRIEIVTRQASIRLAEYAFDYAKMNGRQKVSVIHMANIMLKTDGLFLRCCREVAEMYPDIEYEEVQIDNCCLKLTKNPAAFDVMVMPNQYGDIIGNICAGLIGGLGMTPSFNVGAYGICMAQAAHGPAFDIAGKNLANPTGLLLSTVMMLRHLNLNTEANQIHAAIMKTISEGRYRTADLGGTTSTTDFTKAVCHNL